jgi:hypothetical protein
VPSPRWNRRPVPIDNVVSNLVRTLGDEPEEYAVDAPQDEYKEPAVKTQIAAETNDGDEDDDDDGGIGFGKFLRKDGVGGKASSARQSLALTDARAQAKDGRSCCRWPRG